MNFRDISFLVGIIGDIILQTWVKLAGDVVGLKSYFMEHGIVESLLIAGGLMYVVTIIYEQTKFKINYLNLFIYGIIIDLIMREFNLFPSLDEYYKVLNYFESAILGGLPMILPLFFKDYILPIMSK